MKWICEQAPNLDVQQGQVTELVITDGAVNGIRTSLNVVYEARSVIVTTGTFLRGLLHVGLEKEAGGRAGESAAQQFSDSLRAAGLELGRMKTGTPPRISKKSIDFSKTTPQPGDEPISYFSYWLEDLFHMEQCDAAEPIGKKPQPSEYPNGSILADLGGQLSCHVTYTTQATADLINRSLHKSPLYSGIISGVGPRYCPSIEDKIVRFADKDRHQIFLEPEGVATDEYYLNGFSTSLPFEVQYSLVRTVIGCERAEIMRPAYAVEYDYAPPTQLRPSLETKSVKNLFLAGQINGSSGYEEAAAQGLMAGINAARQLSGQEPIVLSRDQAYIGVLIDDLVTKGTAEPYRMFTSRAEYRLLLRQDNADLRLSELSASIGLLGRDRLSRVQAKRRLVESEIDRLRNTRHNGTTLEQLLRRPEVGYDHLPGSKGQLPAEVIEQVQIEVKYRGYIERQLIEVKRMKTLESKRIPESFGYEKVRGLRNEAIQKLDEVRPSTLGQASRISGITPADISLLSVWLKRGLALEGSTVAEDSR